MGEENGQSSQDGRAPVTVRGVLLEAGKPTPSPYGGLDIYPEEGLRKCAERYNAYQGMELLHMEDGKLIYDGPFPPPKPFTSIMVTFINIEGKLP